MSRLLKRLFSGRRRTPNYVHLLCIFSESSGSLLSSAIYNHRLPPPMGLSLSPSGARHSPAHVHAETRHGAHRAMAGFELRRGVGFLRWGGNVVGT